MATKLKMAHIKVKNPYETQRVSSHRTVKHSNKIVAWIYWGQPVKSEAQSLTEF